jgi:large subunit ribosomal protein L10
MPNAKNIQAVKELREKLTKAKSVTIADYQGLDANKVNELRQKIRNDNAELSVAKNTLVKLAMQEENIDTSALEEDLRGPTAVIFSYVDAIAPIKTLFEFAKKLESPKIKSALVDGVYNDASQVEVLSKLPSKEELIARVVGGLKAPLSGITNVLGGTQRKVVYVLSAIADKREEV